MENTVEDEREDESGESKRTRTVEAARDFDERRGLDRGRVGLVG
jgi:hypothetical protein